MKCLLEAYTIAVATALVIACSPICTVDFGVQVTKIEAKHTDCRQHRCR